MMLFLIFDIIIIYLFSQSIASGKWSFMPRKRGYLFYNFLSVLLVYYFFGIFIIYHHIIILITILLFYVLSLTMYYVHEFRGTNISLSDVLSLNTAKEVAGGYEYKIKPIFVIGLIVVIEECIRRIMIIRQMMALYDSGSLYARSMPHDIVLSLRINFVPLVLFLIILFLLYRKINMSKYDYSLSAGENEGYIYNFFSSIPIFHAKKNSEDILSIDAEVRDLIENAGAIDKIEVDKKSLPHVIVVMNESFGSVHYAVDTDVEVTPYYDSLQGLTKGNLYVNTFGGGTANTEFEFLTSMTIGNYDFPVMPYNNFVKRDKYSLARYFKSLDYKTIAMHPYTATNYHRDLVYKRFGFDELLFFNDFREKKYIRDFVSDESFYEEIIRRYKENVIDGKKLFLFGITMQNHSGYSHFDGEMVKSKIAGEKESIDSYLSLIKISDDALKTLMDYFEKEDERVVILFFGDHNASFGTVQNKLLYGESTDYEFTNAYKVPFFIYDNKSSDDDYIDSISANFLSIELLKKANLPYDKLHDFLSKIYDEYPTYNYHKRKNRNTKKESYIPYDLYMQYEKEYLR